ncbi:TlpA family protein disulfide reductase [Streptococcus pacificus]|uniref:TlpA family protein disulfide reductase n=1 Tax=Streptococcus pacificus TaxID=2740577 RepID=A0ABS0ZJ97_9STRE|nr:TlpA disulfide reductase family protein [Streptococcus pacificus]MBJ8326046.1 TlpA family protein disulfide reductase [Streptococcus pacificus]
MKKYFLLLVSVFLLTACSTTQDNEPSNNNTKTTQETKTEKAPDFTLIDENGETISLSDLKGKKVYVNVWASWCGPCKREFPELEKVYQKVKDKDDIVFLSVTSPNDKQFKNSNPADKDSATILAAAEELGATYPVYFDSSDHFMEDYAIRAFPTHVFINSDGSLAKYYPGQINEEMLEEQLELLQ